MPFVKLNVIDRARRSVGQSTNFSIGFTQNKNIVPVQIAMKDREKFKVKYQQTKAYKPAVGNFGIDNLQLANKSLGKFTGGFVTTSQDYK